MSTPNKTVKSPARSGRALLILALIIFGLLATTFIQGVSSVKLGLDLRGGTSVTLQPRASNDSNKVTSEAIDQAVSIIRQRVDSIGVAESEVTAQGSGTNRQIVISVPGDSGRRVVDLVGQTAELRFRQVLAEGSGISNPADTSTAATPAAGVNADLNAKYAALDCTDPASREGTGADSPADTIVSCSRDGGAKYILAPAEVLGTQVSSAEAGYDPSPRINEAIPSGNAQITGSFSQVEAQDLANVLKYGALPLAFDRGEVQQVSPTLGADQLSAGLLAGALGLGLVLIYSLLYYRGLGLVVVGSLALAALIVYLLFLVLGETIGFTLTLAGIAGAIVAIGVTADSFIVFFERIRDEAREGRSIRSAVESGWAKARHTILVADAVSLIAAALLYFFAVGGVRGFAFTLGLTTLVDLIIVFFFTKPMVSILAGVKFFSSGHPLSGLSPKSIGMKNYRTASITADSTKTDSTNSVSTLEA